MKEKEKMITKTTLVLGGTGQDRPARWGAAHGTWPVRVGSRSGEPPFDWDDRVM